MTLRYTMSVAILGLLCCPLPGQTNEDEVVFSEVRLMAHIEQLSDNSLMGRKAGTAFERRAMEYVSQQLDSLGVQPLPSGRRIQSFRLSSSEDSPTSANVLGSIRPPDVSRLEDVIVLGAHIDHVGETKDGRYYPGADDNASGVALVLEVAGALRRNAQQLRRPVVVAFFGAEEIGLIGSKRFVRDGPIDSAHIAAMVNIDMIGRPLLDQKRYQLLKNVMQIDSSNGIGVIGTADRPFFAQTVKEASATAELTPYGTQAILSPVVEQLARNRSDHSPFERVGIPTLFFSSGESDDYHQPGDTADKLRADLIVRRARLVYETVWALATAPRKQLPPRENAVAPTGKRVPTLELREGELMVQLQDNSRSPQVLSGLQSLTHRLTSDFDAFDPQSPGSSAGLSFEHIICGHQNWRNQLAPRRGRYELYHLPDARSATLVRKREDSPWDMSSTLTYTVRKPHYVDFQFRCTPHSQQLFGKRGHAICCFANYMNAVDDSAIHFLGVNATSDKEQWITSDAPDEHPDWNQGGTFRHDNAPAVEYDDNHDFKQNSWSYDAPRFTQPFYYGRTQRGMVFMLMFDQDSTPQAEIRFTVFQSSRPERMRPAWGFQYVMRRIQENQKYGFQGRLVWKPWVSREDCLAEYVRWRQQAPANETN